MERPLYGWIMLFDCGSWAKEEVVLAHDRFEAWRIIKSRHRNVREIAVRRIED